jgi:lipopolysaccharide transport system ATP-binding protein
VFDIDSLPSQRERRIKTSKLRLPPGERALVTGKSVMGKIKVRALTVDLPIIGYNARSLRRFVVNLGIGGAARKVGNDQVVIRALEGVSFDVNEGERLGIYGHNGSGKSTLLRALAGIYAPTSGTVAVTGQIASLLETTFGLNVDSTGRENIRLLLTYRGFSPSQIADMRGHIEEFTELGSYLELPVRTYSSGMLARLGFAVATCYEPDVLLMDEWLGAGDENFVQKAKKRVDTFVDRANVVVLASHSRELLKLICNKVIVLEQGKPILSGAPKEVFEQLDERNQGKVMAVA